MLITKNGYDEDRGLNFSPVSGNLGAIFLKFYYAAYGLIGILVGLSDFLFYKIPNLLLGLMLLIFILMGVTVGLEHSNHQIIGIEGFGLNTSHNIIRLLIISGIIFFIALVFYALGWIGAGDAKILPIASLWAENAGMWGEFFLMFSLMGGLIALLYLFMSAQIDIIRQWIISLLTPFSQKCSNTKRYFDEPFTPAYHQEHNKKKIPYGVAVVLSSLMVVYHVLIG